MVNLHIYPSPFKFESRILKETKSISDFGLASKIIIVSGWEVGLKKNEIIDSQRSVVRIKLWSRIFPKNTLFDGLRYLEISIRIVCLFLFRKVHVVNCHSLLVLPIGLCMKLVKRSKLIYDTHELETERNGLSGLPKKVSKLMERLAIPFVDSVIVVSDSIAEWYEKEYDIKDVHVIRNIPCKSESTIFLSTVLKDRFGIKDNEILYVYQGVIMKGRGIDILLEAFSKVPSNRHIVFMGYGSEIEKVLEFQKKFPNIHFHEAVPPEQLKYYSASADIGFSLIENTCLSYYYCLPNKLFEYISSGIPVIASCFPDMKAIVEEHKAGWTVNPTSDELYKLVNQLSFDSIKMKKKEIVNSMGSFLSWNNEQYKLKEVFAALKN